jgi:hypothetical protein
LPALRQPRHRIPNAFPLLTDDVEKGLVIFGEQ